MSADDRVPSWSDVSEDLRQKLEQNLEQPAVSPEWLYPFEKARGLLLLGARAAVLEREEAAFLTRYAEPLSDRIRDRGALGDAAPPSRLLEAIQRLLGASLAAHQGREDDEDRLLHEAVAGYTGQAEAVAPRNQAGSDHVERLRLTARNALLQPGGSPAAELLALAELAEHLHRHAVPAHETRVARFLVTLRLAGRGVPAAASFGAFVVRRIPVGDGEVATVARDPFGPLRSEGPRLEPAILRAWSAAVLVDPRLRRYHVRWRIGRAGETASLLPNEWLDGDSVGLAAAAAFLRAADPKMAIAFDDAVYTGRVLPNGDVKMLGGGDAYKAKLPPIASRSDVLVFPAADEDLVDGHLANTPTPDNLDRQPVAHISELRRPDEHDATPTISRRSLHLAQALCIVLATLLVGTVVGYGQPESPMPAIGASDVGSTRAVILGVDHWAGIVATKATSPLAAQFTRPYGVAVTPTGGVLVSDSWDNKVWLVENGELKLIAGTGVHGSRGDNGPAVDAQLDDPRGVAVDPQGGYLIADSGNHRIRRVDNITGIIRPVAGGGRADSSGDGGPASQAMLNDPRALVVDPAGGIYVSEYAGNRIRYINTEQRITTYVGTGVAGAALDGVEAINAQIECPEGLALGAGGSELTFVDSCNRRVRAVRDGRLVTLAGNGQRGAPITAEAATASPLVPSAIAFDSDGTLYISEETQNSVVRVRDGKLEQFAGQPGTPGIGDDGAPRSEAILGGPIGIAAATTRDALYVVDATAGLLREIEIEGQAARILAGARASGAFGAADKDDIRLESAFGIARDPLTGDLYIADTNNRVVRVIHPGGESEVIAGSRRLAPSDPATSASDEPLGLATAEPLRSPIAIAVDNAKRVLYILDWSRAAVFSLDLDDENPDIRVALGVPDRPGSALDPDPFHTNLREPRGMALDAEGGLLVADTENHRVLRLADGKVASVAGTGVSGYSGDGGPARDAVLAYPNDVAVQGDAILVADTSNSRVRRIDHAGVITTIVGDGRIEENQLFDAPRNMVQLRPTRISASGDAIYVLASDRIWRIERRQGYRLADPGEGRPIDLEDDSTLLRRPLGIMAEGDVLWVTDNVTETLLRVTIAHPL